jgi:alanyl-tRNA synthetase
LTRKGTRLWQSSPLVPRNDPTLDVRQLGHGAVQELFTGVEKRDYNRATTAQKCVRAGGKHNDLDNVGYTARHHTFFEMLGNFSFGDYFKTEAIPLAWELITKEFGIDKNKLLTTVYHTDDEAFEFGRKLAFPKIGSFASRPATTSGRWVPPAPVAPAPRFFMITAITFGAALRAPEEDGDRFIEIWNVVFMQNEQFEDGSMRDLDMQSIDTGMGLERIGALLQGKHDNYDTDLIKRTDRSQRHADRCAIPMAPAKPITG